MSPERQRPRQSPAAQRPIASGLFFSDENALAASLAVATIATSIVTVAATPTAAPRSRPCAFTEAPIVPVFYALLNDGSGPIER